MGIRVSKEEELEGLDLSEHAMEAYGESDLMKSADIKLSID